MFGRRRPRDSEPHTQEKVSYFAAPVSSLAFEKKERLQKKSREVSALYEIESSDRDFIVSERIESSTLVTPLFTDPDLLRDMLEQTGQVAAQQLPPGRTVEELDRLTFKAIMEYPQGEENLPDGEIVTLDSPDTSSCYTFKKTDGEIVVTSRRELGGRADSFVIPTGTRVTLNARLRLPSNGDLLPRHTPPTPDEDFTEQIQQAINIYRRNNPES